MQIALAYNVKHNQPSLNPTEQEDFDFDSPETIDVLVKTIESLGHSVLRIEADEGAFSKLKESRNNIDLVFNIAEGLHGDARESQIPLFCEMLNIRYTHSTPTTHAIKLNKAYTKLLLQGVGVKVPASVTIRSAEQELPSDLSFPVILKPNSEGSSIGVFNDNVCHDIKSLRKQLSVLLAKNSSKEFLVEEYIEGREFTVSVIGNFPPRVLPIIEQKFDFLPKEMNRIAGFELKWLLEDSLEKLTDAYDCPARIEKSLEDKINAVSLLAYNTLQVKDCARIDYRLSADGVLYFIEINTLPGINPDEKVISYFPISARVGGFTFKTLIAFIIDNACERMDRKETLVYEKIKKDTTI